MGKLVGMEKDQCLKPEHPRYIIRLHVTPSHLSISVPFDQQLPALRLLVVTHSSNILMMMNLVGSSMQGTRTLNVDIQSRHNNDNHDLTTYEIDDPESGTPPPIRRLKYVAIFILENELRIHQGSRLDNSFCTKRC